MRGRAATIIEKKGATYYAPGIAISQMVLAALGLAITFGVMGVINMAHGELMMLGAYGLFATASLFSGHPLAAIGALQADLGTTLALGVLVSIPVIIVSGPLFGRLAGRWVVVEAPHTFDAAPVADGSGDSRRPSFGITLFSVLLPLVLMLLGPASVHAQAAAGGDREEPDDRRDEEQAVLGPPQEEPLDPGLEKVERAVWRV